MPETLPRPLLRIRYEEAAEEYLRSLPLEHFMEATAQATQRKITLESLDLVQAKRADFQLFNELLVQYPFGRHEKIRQVVPDNMVVIAPEPIRASGSYDIPFQPVKPFWVLEYVSKGNRRKDYEESFRKYERDLKIPYYLVFYPDGQELTLYRHMGKKFVSVKANERGRFAIAELEMEVAILDGWVRYWYQGKLLPLPADLQRDLDETRLRLDETRRDLVKTRHDLDETRQALAAAERETQELRRQVEQFKGRPKNGS
jgi:Uma2 family endonuclease